MKTFDIQTSEYVLDPEEVKLAVKSWLRDHTTVGVVVDGAKSVEVLEDGSAMVTVQFDSKARKPESEHSRA